MLKILLQQSPLGRGLVCVVATIRLGTVYHQSKRPPLVVTTGAGETGNWLPCGGVAASSSSKQLRLTATGLEAGGHCCPEERGLRRRRLATQSQGGLSILLYPCFMNMHAMCVCVCVCDQAKSGHSCGVCVQTHEYVTTKHANIACSA